jgi:hypothetical protein
MPVHRHPIATFAACAMLALLPGCFGDSSSEGGRTNDPIGARVPSEARIVEEGDGPLSYTAAADGTVYVQDAKERRTIVSRRVDRGDRVRIEFDADRVRVNDDTIYDGNLERDHEHRIYFVRADSREDDRRDRTDRRDDGRNRAGDKVPLSATLVGEGRDEELTYRASRDGTIYVYDAEDERVIGSAGIRDGQRFTIAPDRNRATINNDEVDVGKLSTRRNYRVYFDGD